jgi:SWI/SNF-related matrix-associated actin-dependent regulator of chromatin subfamily A member 5
LENYGRFGLANIIKEVSNECGKSEEEVKRYYVSFWCHYKRISDWQKILERIIKGERKILRLRQIRDLIHEKIERHFDETYGKIFDEKKLDPLPTSDQLLDHSWQTLKLKYVAGSKNRSYTEEEDAFLLCMMHRHGYGNTERIRLEIRKAWQFRFNWYFKSRNSLEIQRRCESIVKMVEKEIEELRKAEQEQKNVEASVAPVQSEASTNVIPQPIQG